MFKNKTVIVTSNEPWGDIWYSKQNYAFELARTNKVVFIDPPRKWSPINVIKNRLELKQQFTSLYVLKYGNYFPVRVPLLNLLNNFLVSRTLKTYLKKKSLEPDILWAFDPMRLYIPRLLGVRASIYHCVDYYYFKFFGEKQLCRYSTVIFATSQFFLDEFSAFSTPKYVVPHGISQEEFSLDEKRKKVLKLPDPGFALYIGVIDHRMDFDMYEKSICAFPDLNFVFVGPLRITDHPAAERIFKNNTYQNVIIEGPKHFKELKYYIDSCLLCMSFMDMSYHANTVHHHKTLVYLAQGKPVFSFLYEEYKPHPEIMYMSNSHDALIAKMKHFIEEGEPEDYKISRIKHASQFTFDKVLELAHGFLKKHI